MGIWGEELFLGTVFGRPSPLKWQGNGGSERASEWFQNLSEFRGQVEPWALPNAHPIFWNSEIFGAQV